VTPSSGIDLRGKLRDFAARLRYVPATLRLVRQAAGHLFTWWIVVLVIQGLLPVASVYLTRALVNRLAAVVAGPAGQAGASIAASIYPIMALGAGLVAVLFGAELLRAVADYLRSLQATLGGNGVEARGRRLAAAPPSGRRGVGV
jgi:ATP-binding cassette subfamily B protein